MNEIELQKELNKFQEMMDLIILSEFCLDYGQYTKLKSAIEQIKFACIKYDLLEFDEIENLSDLESKDYLEFTENLKTQIKNQFFESIKN